MLPPSLRRFKKPGRDNAYNASHRHWAKPGEMGEPAESHDWSIALRATEHPPRSAPGAQPRAAAPANPQNGGGVQVQCASHARCQPCTRIGRTPPCAKKCYNVRPSLSAIRRDVFRTRTSLPTFKGFHDNTMRRMATTATFIRGAHSPHSSSRVLRCPTMATRTLPDWIGML